MYSELFQSFLGQALSEKLKKQGFRKFSLYCILRISNVIVLRIVCFILFEAVG